MQRARPSTGEREDLNEEPVGRNQQHLVDHARNPNILYPWVYFGTQFVLGEGFLRNNYPKFLLQKHALTQKVLGSGHACTQAAQKRSTPQMG